MISQILFLMTLMVLRRAGQVVLGLGLYWDVFDVFSVTVQSYEWEERPQRWPAMLAISCWGDMLSMWMTTVGVELDYPAGVVLAMLLPLKVPTSVLHPWEGGQYAQFQILGSKTPAPHLWGGICGSPGVLPWRSCVSSPLLTIYSVIYFSTDSYCIH